MTWWIIGSLVGLALLFVVIIETRPQHRFIDACGNKDIEKLKKLLANKPDLNQTGWFGLTPLGEAISNNCVENVKILLDAGALVSIPGASRSHLHSVAENGDVEIGKILLDAGADPNLPDKSGRSPFVLACLWHHVELAKLLLENGANADTKFSYGNDPKEELIAVVVGQASSRQSPIEVQNQVAIIELLLDHGANINARSNKGAPLVGLALPSIPVLKCLIDRGATTDVSWDGTDLEMVIKTLLEESEGKQL